jgi:hypothetical protein
MYSTTALMTSHTTEGIVLFGRVSKHTLAHAQAGMRAVEPAATEPGVGWFSLICELL